MMVAPWLSSPDALRSAPRSARSKLRIRSLINGGTRKLVFDLTEVELIDSAGLGMLVYTYGSLAAKGGALRLCGVTPRILSLLELTKMNTLLAVDATRQESLAAIKA